MSDPQETLKTLSALQREFQAETSKLQQQRSNLSNALPGREQIVEEHLNRAKNFYKKKEWASAFSEWDQACAYLIDQDEFRKKVDALKESHDNLIKVNREVVEIKQALNQRSSPKLTDRKFVQGAHEEVSGQVRNVYSYLGQQLRTERTPRTLSFWWPVLLSLGIVAAGAAGLFAFNTFLRAQANQQAEQSVQEARLQVATAETERDVISKKSLAQKEDYDKRIQELKSQNAGWRNAGREKIEELEGQLSEAQRKNDELTQKIQKMMEENLKDFTS
jgi:hypothetical protein